MMSPEEQDKELRKIYARFLIKRAYFKAIEHERKERKAMKRGDQLVYDVLCGALCAMIFVFVCWQLLVAAVS
jgi:hypothetical protein